MRDQTSHFSETQMSVEGGPEAAVALYSVRTEADLPLTRPFRI